MTKVLLLGASPLPTENTTRSYAAGLRTWQFAKALTQGGHDVVLVCSRIPFVYATHLESIVESRDAELNVVRFDVSERALVDGEFLLGLIARERPACIVGAHTFPSSVAAGLKTDLPIWADLNGHLMAEAQVKASTYENDQFLDHFWKMERAILDRSDALSVVSEAQRYATLGELGTRQRLNRYTVGYEIVHRIPDVCPPVPTSTSAVNIRGTLVPEDAFIVLWSGAYNTWTDVRSLFEGLERAMTQASRLYFVSTGGQIEGHDDFTYPTLLRLIERSPHKNRFVMRGWLPAAEVPSYQGAADLAINLDGRNLEAELGTRTRLLGWAAGGLPIISTVVCELTRELDAQGALYGFPVSDPAGLGDALIRAASDPEREHRARLAAAYVAGQYTWEAATVPLVEWCRTPRRAPDQARKRSSTWSREREPSALAAGLRLRDLCWLAWEETRLNWKHGGPPAVLARFRRFWDHQRHVLRKVL
jgi:glycosyltransferase involved in cell wall biosynthesis